MYTRTSYINVISVLCLKCYKSAKYELNNASRKKWANGDNGNSHN